MGVSFLMKNVKATATFPSSITNGPRIVDFYVRVNMWSFGTAHSLVIDGTRLYISSTSFHDPTKPLQSERIHQW
jgi:hypothetical protein